MSRTYRSITYWGWFDMRRTPESELYGYANVKGAYWNWRRNSVTKFVMVEKTGHPSPEPPVPWFAEKNLCRLNGVKLGAFRNRDKKPWHKPDSEFKRIREGIFRAKCKHELRTGRMDFPTYRKSDIWNWI